jgi:hypothetical protein
VIKSEIRDVHVDIFLESHDVIFFENIFPMKNLYGMSSLPTNVITDTSPEPSEIFDHAEHTPESIHEEIDSEVSRRSKRSRTVKSLVMNSLSISWMTLLKPLSRHLHLLIRMIEKKQSIVRWTQFSPMVVNSWFVSGSLKRSLGQMVLLISTRQVLWPRVIPKRKAKISLILIHLLLD